MVGGFQTSAAWNPNDVAGYQQEKHEAAGQNAETSASNYETQVDQLSPSPSGPRSYHFRQ